MLLLVILRNNKKCTVLVLKYASNSQQSSSPRTSARSYLSMLYKIPEQRDLLCSLLLKTSGVTVYKHKLPTIMTLYKYIICTPVPATWQSKASVCGRSLAGIAGSNPAEGMLSVCLL
jgi:hypothetical protein